MLSNIIHRYTTLYISALQYMYVHIIVHVTQFICLNVYIRFLGKWDNIIRENFCGGRGRVNHAGIQIFFFQGGWNKYLSLPGRGGGVGFRGMFSVILLWILLCKYKKFEFFRLGGPDPFLILAWYIKGIYDDTQRFYVHVVDALHVIRRFSRSRAYVHV